MKTILLIVPVFGEDYNTLNKNHPLFILSNRSDWELFEDAFSPLHCADTGLPAKPIRLMVGLLILKHLRNVSDESVAEQWTENLYYQYFCGLQQFSTESPCALRIDSFS